jgi:hypothetical protein
LYAPACLSAVFSSHAAYRQRQQHAAHSCLAALYRVLRRRFRAATTAADLRFVASPSPTGWLSRTALYYCTPPLLHFPFFCLLRAMQQTLPGTTRFGSFYYPRFIL